MANAVPPPILHGEFPNDVPVVICPGADWDFILQWASTFGGTQISRIPVPYTGATAQLMIRSSPSDVFPLLSISTTQSSNGLITLGATWPGAGTVWANSPKSFTSMLAYGMATYDTNINWAGGEITTFARGSVLIAPVGIIHQDFEIIQYADDSFEWTWYVNSPTNPIPCPFAGAQPRMGIRSCVGTAFGWPEDILDLSSTPTSYGSITLDNEGHILWELTAAGVDLLSAFQSTPFIYQVWIDWADGTTWCWANGAITILPGNVH